jgi:hypothetical protein
MVFQEFTTEILVIVYRFLLTVEWDLKEISLFLLHTLQFKIKSHSRLILSLETLPCSFS